MRLWLGSSHAQRGRNASLGPNIYDLLSVSTKLALTSISCG